MSAIESIGNAIQYDACERMLVAGCSLNDVLAMAVRLSDVADDSDVEALSLRSTELATIAPGSR